MKTAFNICQASTFGAALLLNISVLAGDQFVSMFDGRTLSSWDVAPVSAKEAWTVRDGMIVGNGDRGRSYLVFKNHNIADFEMKLSYRFPGEGNSGVSIRARKDETGRRDFQSYHADFGHVGIGKKVLGAWDFHTPGRTEHRCFRGDRLMIDKNDKPTITSISETLSADDVNKGDWNDVHIVARGNKFSFYLNGKLASEFAEHLPEEKRLNRGMIQLQLHDPGMFVHFRNLRIKIMD
ncbi:MAG: DUF1080 domain-containing protein [Fuerstiella sp.]|nr:DUF1080 domain-containing protein [Fuerstiella sp.]